MADTSVVVKIGAEVSGIRGGAQEANSALGSIQDRLKEFKSEAVSTGRQARFFANDLAELIPGADGAKAALRDLIAVGLSGSVFGAAVEGAKLLVLGLHALGDAAGTSEKEFKKLLETSEQVAASLRKQAEAQTLALAGYTPEQIKLIQSKNALLTEEIGINNALDAVRAKLAAIEVANATQDSEQRHVPVLLLKQENDLLERQGEIKRKLAAINAPGAVLVSNEAAASARQTAAALEEIESAHNLRMLSLKVQLLDGAAKLQAEYDLKVATIRARADTTEEQDDQEVALEKAILLKKFGDLQETELEKALAAQRRVDNLRLQSWIQSQDAMFKYFKEKEDAKLNEQLSADAKMQEEDRRAAKQFATDFVMPIEQAFKSAIHSMLDGSKDFAAAMHDLMMSLVNAVIDGFLKMVAQQIIAAITSKAIDSAKALAEVTHNAAIAGSAVAAATAPFLLFGAIGAGAAMAGEVMATFTPMATALRGMPIVPRDMPVFVHGGEAILNRGEAEDWRSGRAGGGDVHVTFNIQAWDGTDVRRVIESPDFIRGLREAARNGLL